MSRTALIPQPAVEGSASIIKISSPYRLIEIKQHPNYGNLLVIDNDLQIAESDHAYGRAMALPLTRSTPIERVLIMGGGDGGVLQELLRAADNFGWPMQEAVMVDIDSEVIQNCRKFLPRLNAGAFNDRRTQVLITDVFSHLKHQRNLDAVICDLTMTPFGDNLSQTDFIAETLANIAQSLRSGGVLSMQCCGEGKIGPLDGEENQLLLENIRHQVDRFFVQRREEKVAIPSYREDWTFLSARKQ